MQGSLDQPPIVVKASRARSFWVVVGSALFVSIGIFVWTPNVSVVMRVICIGFFGLCGIIGLASLISPPRLEIGPSGLKQTVLWRTAKFAWTDICNFRPAIIGLINKTVGFDYLSPRRKRSALRSVNFAIAGVQGALQPGLKIAPRELADLLNAARERWLERAEESPLAASATRSMVSPLAGFAGARMNRRVYWLSIAAIYVIAIVFGFIPGMSRAIGVASSLFLIRVFASRLHDLGRSGWWQLAFYFVQIALIVFVATAGRQSTVVTIGVGVLIQLVFVTVLGAIPGDRNSNRFGPAPGEPTSTAVSETFR